MAVDQDLTRPPDLHRDAAEAGPRRTRRPVYVDLLPPCNNACPAGENIQAWLAAAQAGEYERAWRILVRDNPLPAVHGRVCYHPCQSACNRTALDSAVSIHSVERFLGDLALEQNWTPDPPAAATGKKVLIVGAGPSGLSAAWHLARLGHAVTLREAGPVAGGMLHFGIPAYRLPRAVMQAEVARIQSLGVIIETDHRVTDLLAEQQAGDFDAVFVAVGAHIGKKVDIPARDAGKIIDAVDYLRRVDAGDAPRLGRRVAVYGGGNTAMDAARVAQRLGAAEALIVYRRDRQHMPAHAEEAADAEAEGVKINWLRTIRAFDADQLTVEVMRINAEGRPEPTGATEQLSADSLILALGQDTDTDFLRQISGMAFKSDGTVVVGPDLMTGHAGIFAGGDMVPDQRTVTVAVGHGKKAARHIHAWLGGALHRSAPKHPVVDFDQLHVWFFTDAAQRQQPELELESRRDNFEEVVGGLGEAEARYEARRCLSCGNCFECDGCLGACPEKAVIKLGVGQRYRFDLDKCTGCAICFEQCPCHAIEMQAETEPA